MNGCRETTETAGVTSAQNAGPSIGAVIGIVAAVIIVIAVVAVAILKKKKLTV